MRTTRQLRWVRDNIRLHIAAKYQTAFDSEASQAERDDAWRQIAEWTKLYKDMGGPCVEHGKSHTKQLTQ